MTDQEIPVTAEDPYLKAKAHPFLGGLDIIPGVLDWRVEMQTKWYDYLHQTSAITRDSLQFLPEEDKGANKPKVWATFGSIEAESAGTVKEFFRELERTYDEYVRSSARNARKNAGWQPGHNNQYLIDPDGNTSPPGGNGMPYGAYSMPTSTWVKGDKWTADLQPGHRYTK